MALTELASHSKRFHAEFGGGLADHLPMALAALEGLGADTARREEFAAHYARQLDPAPAPVAAPDEAAILDRLGEPGLYPEALAFFDAAVARESAAPALRRFLPRLADGVAAVAFHGAIRTAYGLSADIDEEVAAGLAYWSAHFIPVSLPTNSGTQNGTIAALLGEISDVFARHRDEIDLAQPGITVRIAEVLSHRELSDALARAASYRPLTFEALSETALAIYLETDDFTALHGVTGAHAARALSSVLDPGDDCVLVGCWAGLCAAYASFGAPPLSRPLTAYEEDPPDWKTIREAAIASNDDHDVKLTFSCAQEAAHYGRDRLYRLAAARRLGLI